VRDKNCDQLKKAFSFLSKNAIQDWLYDDVNAPQLKKEQQQQPLKPSCTSKTRWDLQ
jgi:hypothetical protein